MNNRMRLQRKKHSTAYECAPQLAHSTLISRGQPLDSATRAFMEPRFGHDFGAMRVHNDTQATEAAELEADQTSKQVVSSEPSTAMNVSSVAQQPLSLQRWFGNGEELKDDFWGTKAFLGKKWGGVADASISAIWNLGGAIPEFGTIEGLAGAHIDELKSLISLGIGAYHTYIGNRAASDADLKAAKRFGHDMELSAASAIPIWGIGQGIVTGLWDAASAIDRANNGTLGPLSGDIWDEVSPL